jgi:hypothetical protein
VFGKENEEMEDRRIFFYAVDQKSINDDGNNWRSNE